MIPSLLHRFTIHRVQHRPHRQWPIHHQDHQLALPLHPILTLTRLHQLIDSLHRIAIIAVLPHLVRLLLTSHYFLGCSVQARITRHSLPRYCQSAILSLAAFASTNFGRIRIPVQKFADRSCAQSKSAYEEQWAGQESVIGWEANPHCGAAAILARRSLLNPFYYYK